MHRTCIMGGEVGKTRLEDDLMIYSWGMWAKDRIDKMLGHKPAPWAHLMDTKSGYDESHKHYIPRAAEDYCEKLDRMIAMMDDTTKAVLVCLYSQRMNLSELSEMSGMKRHEIRFYRDAALNQLHGALYLSRAG